MEERISTKYVMTLIKKIKVELQSQYNISEIQSYLGRWVDWQDRTNPKVKFCFTVEGDFDIETTINNIDDETVLKIAIDLGIETPDFIPSIPIFKNEIKHSYKTASKTFEQACKKVNDEPDTAISLANAALESVVKEILKDERLKDEHYNDKDTLYKLAEKCLKIIKVYPSQNIPKEVNQIGSGLLNCCQAIENIRSDKTLVAHGKTDGDIIIEDSTSAFFVVNAVTAIGLFLLKQYQAYYPISANESEMPF